MSAAMMRSPNPNAKAISVVLGASETMRCGGAEIVTVRFAPSVKVIAVADDACDDVAVAASAGALVGAAVGGTDVAVGAGAHAAIEIKIIARTIGPTKTFRAFMFLLL